jgi:Tc5 transposase DNA-binding domain
MNQAINSVERAELRSIRATALAYGVDRTTLTWRLNGGFQRNKGHTSQQLLSPGQEDILVTWVLEQERLGHAPMHQRVREYAAKICGYSGQGSHIGNHWLTRFITRNLDV